MGIIGWVLFGFVVGLIARAVMPGKDSMGLIGTTVLGVIGALLGGWIGQALGWYRADEGAGFIAATIGAVAVLAIYNFASRRMSRKPVSGMTQRGSKTFGSDTNRDRDRDRKDRAA